MENFAFLILDFSEEKQNWTQLIAFPKNPHGWTSILGKFTVDPCFPLNSGAKFEFNATDRGKRDKGGNLQLFAFDDHRQQR